MKGSYENKISNYWLKKYMLTMAIVAWTNMDHYSPNLATGEIWCFSEMDMDCVVYLVCTFMYAFI